MSSADQKQRQLAHLDAQFADKIDAIKRVARLLGATSNARAELRDCRDRCEPLVIFRSQSRIPLFYWLRYLWECIRVFMSPRVERSQPLTKLEIADLGLDAWARKREQAIVKDWNEKRNAILSGVSVVPGVGLERNRNVRIGR